MVQVTEHAQILTPGQEFVHRRILSGQSDAVPDLIGLLFNIEPIDVSDTLRWLQQSCENSNCGRFARTIWSQKANHLPPGYD